MGSSVTESDDGIKPDDLQHREAGPRLVCRKMPLESDATQQEIESSSNYRNPSPPPLDLPCVSQSSSVFSSSLNQVTTQYCRPNDVSNDREIAHPNCPEASSSTHPPFLRLVNFENRFTRMVIDEENIVRGPKALGFSKFITCNLSKAPKYWQKESKHSHLKKRECDLQLESKSSQKVEENKKFEDVKFSFRCKRFLKGKSCDGSCKKLHQLPKEDGVKCVSEVHGQCHLGRRCIFLHDGADSDSDDENPSASSTTALHLESRKALELNSRNASESLASTSQNETCVSEIKPNFSLENIDNLTPVNSHSANARIFSTSSSTPEIFKTENCSNQMINVTVIPSTVTVKNEEGNSTRVTPSHCAENMAGTLQSQISIYVKLEPPDEEIMFSSSSATVSSSPPAISRQSLKRERAPELSVSKKSKLSLTEKSGSKSLSSSSTSKNSHCGIIKYEPPELPLYKQEVMDYTTPSPQINTGNLKIPSKTDRPFEAVIKREPRSDEVPLCKQEQDSLSTPQYNPIVAKVPSKADLASEAVIKRKPCSALTIKVPESFKSSEENLRDVSDGLLQIIKDTGQWDALGLQSSEPYIALSEYLTYYDAPKLNDSCLPKAVVWDVHIRLAFLIVIGDDPRGYFEKIESHLATESLDTFLSNVLNKLKQSPQ